MEHHLERGGRLSVQAGDRADAVAFHVEEVNRSADVTTQSKDRGVKKPNPPLAVDGFFDLRLFGNQMFGDALDIVGSVQVTSNGNSNGLDVTATTIPRTLGK